jgi:ABC-type polar amino acid transport system ATPase subunit
MAIGRLQGNKALELRHLELHHSMVWGKIWIGGDRGSASFVGLPASDNEELMVFFCFSVPPHFTIGGNIINHPSGICKMVRGSISGAQQCVGAARKGIVQQQRT